MADATFREDLLSGSRIEERLQTPRLWRVLLHNDDFTTQEFVVWVLETVFQKDHYVKVVLQPEGTATGEGGSAAR